VLPPWTTVWELGAAEREKSGAGAPPQEVNLNDPIRVCQLKLPLAAKYSLVYQKVQSSAGSMLMLL